MHGARLVAQQIESHRNQGSLYVDPPKSLPGLLMHLIVLSITWLITIFYDMWISATKVQPLKEKVP
jgi:hypothetical protein